VFHDADPEVFSNRLQVQNMFKDNIF